MNEHFPCRSEERSTMIKGVKLSEVPRPRTSLIEEHHNLKSKCPDLKENMKNNPVKEEQQSKIFLT